MNKLTVLLLTLLLLFSLGGCDFRAAAQTLDNMEDAVENSMDAIEDAGEAAIHSAASAATTAGEITKEEAESIALNYVNLTADQVTRLRTEYEIDDGIRQYDVQFYVNQTEYEFEINAQTGDIISFDRDD